MKTFMEEYGLIVVAAIIIMIFVLVATPIGTSLKDGVRTTVDKFTSSMVADEDDTISGSISVTAKDSEGNDLNASARNITGEENDTLLASLESASLIASTDDVDALIDVQSDDFDGLAETTFDVSTIAKEGDTVVILHYDETASEWEYITTDTVDANLTVGGDFSSYSPVAFVVISGDGSGSEEEETLAAGAYFFDGTFKDWETLKSEGYVCVIKNCICGDSTYEYGEDINILIIPDGITSIDGESGLGYGTIKNLVIPDSVTYIKYDGMDSDGTAGALTDIYGLETIYYSGTAETDDYYWGASWNSENITIKPYSDAIELFQ